MLTSFGPPSPHPVILSISLVKLNPSSVPPVPHLLAPLRGLTTLPSDCADVMPEDMATVAIGIFAADVEAIELFTAAVEPVDESSILNAALASGI